MLLYEVPEFCSDTTCVIMALFVCLEWIFFFFKKYIPDFQCLVVFGCTKVAEFFLQV